MFRIDRRLFSNFDWVLLLLLLRARREKRRAGRGGGERVAAEGGVRGGTAARATQLRAART